jgi:hypothetical protein
MDFKPAIDRGCFISSQALHAITISSDCVLRSIVVMMSPVLDERMVSDRTSIARRRVLIDDRARLPSRFFGRFATSATSEYGAALWQKR